MCCINNCPLKSIFIGSSCTLNGFTGSFIVIPVFCHITYYIQYSPHVSDQKSCKRVQFSKKGFCNKRSKSALKCSCALPKENSSGPLFVKKKVSQRFPGPHLVSLFAITKLSFIMLSAKQILTDCPFSILLNSILFI